MSNLKRSSQKRTLLSDTLRQEFPWLKGIKKNGGCSVNYEEPRSGADVISDLCDFYTRLRKEGK